MTYLASLKTYTAFLKFMTDSEEGYAYDSNKIDVLNRVIDKWTKFLRKRRRLVKNQQVIDNREVPKVNPDDFKRYFESIHVQETKELMRQKGPVIRTTHSRVSNYIVFRLLAANCHRAGNLMNSTCEEFLGAKVDKKNNTYVVHCEPQNFR